MLVYSIGNGPEQIAPTAHGEAFRLWKPPGLDTPPDNVFGWGPMASVLLNKMEEVACAAFMAMESQYASKQRTSWTVHQ